MIGTMVILLSTICVLIIQTHVTALHTTGGWLQLNVTLSPRTSASAINLPTKAGIDAAATTRQNTSEQVDWTNPAYEQFLITGGHRMPENFLDDVIRIGTQIHQADLRLPPAGVATSTPFAPRYGSVLLRADPSNHADARIILIGGVSTGLTYLSDVWTTADPDMQPESWKLLSTGEFPGRSSHCGVSLDKGETIIIWAGYSQASDCWISTNGGKNFQARNAPYWPNRSGASCAVLKSLPDPDNPGDDSTETLWMVGGKMASSGTLSKEVWFSRNRGQNWHAQREHFPGQPRAWAGSVYGLFAVQPTFPTLALSSDAPPGPAPFNFSSLTPTFIIHGGESSLGFPNVLNDTWMTQDFVVWTRLSDLSGRSEHSLLLNSLGQLYSFAGQTQQGSMGMESSDVFVYLGEPSPDAEPSTDDDASSVSSSPSTTAIILAIIGAIGTLLIVGFLIDRRYDVYNRLRHRRSGGHGRHAFGSLDRATRDDAHELSHSHTDPNSTHSTNHMEEEEEEELDDSRDAHWHDGADKK